MQESRRDQQLDPPYSFDLDDSDYNYFTGLKNIFDGPTVDIESRDGKRYDLKSCIKI